MNIRFLEAFTWVARLRSFRAAAEKLNVSQATISSRISTLEEQFQCRLFDRDRNEVVLSHKGTLLLEKAQLVLDAELSLKEAISEEVEPVGRIRIGVVESIVHTWLGRFLAQLTQTYPKLEFELTAEPTPHLQALFLKGALDIILQTDPILDEAVTNLELSPLELGWVCRADNPLASRDVTLSEIAEQQIITFTRGSKPHLSVLSLFEEAGLKSNHIHCVTSLAAIMVLVREGLGIATIPIKGLSKSMSSKDISIINMQPVPQPLSIIASWHRDSDNDLRTNVVTLAKIISEDF